MAWSNGEPNSDRQRSAMMCEADEIKFQRYCFRINIPRPQGENPQPCLTWYYRWENHLFPTITIVFSVDVLYSIIRKKRFTWPLPFQAL